MAEQTLASLPAVSARRLGEWALGGPTWLNQEHPHSGLASQQPMYSRQLSPSIQPPQFAEREAWLAEPVHLPMAPQYFQHESGSELQYTARSVPCSLLLSP